MHPSQAQNTRPTTSLKISSKAGLIDCSRERKDGWYTMQSDHMQGVTSANLSSETWKTPQSGQKAGRGGLRRDSSFLGFVKVSQQPVQRAAALTLTAHNSPTWRIGLLSPFGRICRQSDASIAVIESTLS